MDDADRHRRLRELFHAAVELSEPERSEFVDRACGSDLALRGELESLLAEDDPSVDPVEERVRQAARAFAGTETGEPGPVEHIGRYPVLGKIAEGGMGVVHLGWDPSLSRRVAIKVLPAAIVRDVPSLARFHREAQLLAAISHPNIATIHTLEETSGLHFLTMEFIEGESLEERLARGVIEIEEALTTCRQVATALEVAHRSRVLHRDLKPANVMITPNGLVKVLDFGLATTVGLPEASFADGKTAGTPGYMSPEQLRGDATSFPADVWSFGCILYECLTGKPAFPGGTSPARLAATVRNEVDWSALPDETPDSLRGLLGSCLVSDPASRLDDIAQARRVLDDVCGSLSPTIQNHVVSHESGRSNNLPTSFSSFVGRSEVIERLERLLRVHRLVTISGPGGSGKTRLAVEVARRHIPEFDAGVWIAELAPLARPELVLQEVADVLRVREQAHASLIQSLADHISSRRLLLILDNCEHLLPACARGAEDLLRRCPNLHILITSREKLGITGEVVLQIPAMERPPRTPVPYEQLSEIESVRLFVDRASAEAGGFSLTAETAPHVARICRHLDGIPLALELAAARVGVLSVSEIAERLGDRFGLLSRGSKTAIPQHQTLRALIDWSYDLLTPVEKKLLRALSIFAGGWSLQAVERVGSGEDLDQEDVLDVHSRLVEKSLVEVDTEDCRTCEQARFRMLDTIREYATERREEAGESGPLHRRHREHFLWFAEETRSKLSGPNQVAWYDLWRSEHENFRQALAGFENDGDGASGLRLAAALGQFWDVSGYFTDGRAILAHFLDLGDAQESSAARGLALEWAGRLAYRQGDYAESERSFLNSLRIRERLADTEGIAVVRGGLGSLAQAQGDVGRARREYEESLAMFRKLGNEDRISAMLYSLGSLALQYKDLDGAREYLEEGRRLCKEGSDWDATIVALHYLGELAMYERKYEEAQALLAESLSLARELDEPHATASILHDLGRLAQRCGDGERSHALQAESLRIRWGLKDRLCSSRCILAFGVLAAQNDAPHRAVRLFGAADAILDGIRSPMTPVYRDEVEPRIQKLRSELAPEIFEREWSKGVSMPMEELVEYATHRNDA